MNTQAMTAIVGDLVQSRRKAGRESLSERISEALGGLAQEFAAELHAPLALTRGIDELSGVLKRPDHSYRICRALNESVHPHVFRFVVVHGLLDVGLSSRHAGCIDGPAFHAAADLMSQAKRLGACYTFRLGFAVPELEELVNGAANLLHTLRVGWTDHQRRVVLAYVKLQHQEQVATELGITQQAVSDALREAHWRLVGRNEALLDRVFGVTGLYT